MVWLCSERGHLAHLYDSTGHAVCGGLMWPSSMRAARKTGKRCPECESRWDRPLSKYDVAKSGHFGVKAMRRALKDSPDP